MRDTLIVLNYQREFPPFMQSVLHHAEPLFKRILYITPVLHNDNREACRCRNLQVVQMTSRRKRAFLKLPAFLLRKETRRQIATAIRHGNFRWSFIKNMIAYGVCSDMLYSHARQIIEKEKLYPENCLVVAAWFHVEAYAGGKLKERFPGLRLMSYAHGFEVNEGANPQAMFSMNTYKHAACDEVAFISATTRQRYLGRFAQLYPKASAGNTSTHYLGSEKLFPEALSKKSDDGVLRLVSCSGAVPVKRIHLIIEMLTLSVNRIHWTHIGGGPLLEHLQQLACEKLSGKSNISYEFLGSVPNSRVQQFYRDHPVDLFVNTSESEGLPVSIMESLSYGIPVIATDVGGTREIVTEATGFLLPKELTGQELARTVARYGAVEAQKKDHYRHNAFALWQERLDGQRNAKDFLSSQRDQ